MTTIEVLVDPKRMLRVRFETAPGQAQDIGAITCAYVPAVGPDGVTRVAVQIIWDPGLPNPGAPYYCPEDRLARFLVAPQRVKLIQPYQAE